MNPFNFEAGKVYIYTGWTFQLKINGVDTGDPVALADADVMVALGDSTSSDFGTLARNSDNVWEFTAGTTEGESGELVATGTLDGVKGSGRQPGAIGADVVKLGVIAGVLTLKA